MCAPTDFNRPATSVALSIEEYRADVNTDVNTELKLTA
jgi:hypothetical protein